MEKAEFFSTHSWTRGLGYSLEFCRWDSHSGSRRCFNCGRVQDAGVASLEKANFFETHVRGDEDDSLTVGDIVLQVWRKPMSFDTHVAGDEEDGITMGDIVEDVDAPAVDYDADQVILAGNVDNVLHTLSERERGVIYLRYGLDGEEPRTLEEVGEVYKVR
jgi:hypothetical protein